MRTIVRVLRRLRIENLVLIREAELELVPGLNAITGETGAGKTILAQAIGLLLGSRGDSGLVGPEGAEAYVEAELDLPDTLLEEEGLEALADLRPQDEEGLVLARRVFSDGRTRAYAWGRAAARDDVAAAAERLLAMSGQFEQRRLARASYQLDVLDAFSGDEQLRRRGEERRARRWLLMMAKAPLRSLRLPSGRSHHSSRSRRSSGARATSCATSSCACGRPPPSCVASSRRSTPSQTGSSRSRGSSTESPRRSGVFAARRTTSCSHAQRRRAKGWMRWRRGPIRSPRPARRWRRR